MLLRTVAGKNIAGLNTNRVLDVAEKNSDEGLASVSKGLSEKFHAVDATNKLWQHGFVVLASAKETEPEPSDGGEPEGDEPAGGCSCTISIESSTSTETTTSTEGTVNNE